MLIFLIKILYRLGLLKYLDLVVIKELNDFKVRIPLKGITGYVHLHSWEPWMIDILKRMQTFQPQAFIDVGANLGQSLIAIKTLSPGIQYLGFEPNPHCIAYLNNLILQNKWQNTTIIEAAISQTKEELNLNLYNSVNTDGAASIISDYRPGKEIRSSLEVQAIGPEEVESISKNFPFGILKIDVEGAELEVLKAFELYINAKKPLIMMEILPVYRESFKLRKDRQIAVENLLLDMNYQTVKIWLEDEKLHHLEMIDEIGIHGDIHQVNYLFVPLNKVSDFTQSFESFF